jgi:sulfatase maturation enzyme AslB (radical SAM superfamily)
MRLLAGSGIRMSVRTMVMKSNYRDVMRNATADMNCVIGLPLTLRRDRDASKNAAIIKERLTADEIDRFSREFHRNYVSARRNGGMLYRHLDACHCSTLNRMLLCDGNITWCHMMPSPFNLKTMTYCEASRRLYSEGSLFRQQDKACGSCAHRAYCKWCPGKAFLETGSTTKKIPYLCGVMKGLHKRGG